LSGGELSSVEVPGASATFSRGINNRGNIVGNYTSAGATHGYLLRGGEFTTIDFPGASSTGAAAINSRGEIVGTYTIGGVTHSYQLTER